jgi:hypothetical protein
MKAFLFSLIALGSFSVFGQTALDLTGFKVISNTATVKVYNFRDEMEFKISKARFSTHESAVEFCEKQKSKLDVDYNSLLIAMSGAPNFDEFLKESIAFKVKDASGIWQWSKEKDNVTYMIDGHGVSADDISMKDMSNLKIEISLPAICVKKL